MTGRGVATIVAAGLLFSGCVNLLTPGPPGLVARADAQLQSGNYRAAIALYDEFLQASPADPAALRVRATRSLLEVLLQSEATLQRLQQESALREEELTRARRELLELRAEAKRVNVSLERLKALDRRLERRTR